MDREKPGMSSEVLGRDIEEIREKIERMKKDREEKEGQGIKKAREGVMKCYKLVDCSLLSLRGGALMKHHRDKSDRPLDCWREVEAFKEEVGKLEKVS